MDEGDLGSTDWSTTPIPSLDEAADSDVVSIAMQRSTLIKKITTLQDDLKTVLERIDEVQVECDRKKAENEMLQTYVNNLTRQNMLITSSK
ncbi:hypothetical protein O181_002438 [Austropuccinia psidii MF-1]|uniref:Uncharacterized protein n=1 Tax=Austropuccinia psidii MF-1 TaxID=1389203 RepID=A0A9Q3BCH4_9BASI|nr:hypothetical protein [Austropuccinia psidii MF-1]